MCIDIVWGGGGGGGGGAFAFRATAFSQAYKPTIRK